MKFFILHSRQICSELWNVVHINKAKRRTFFGVSIVTKITGHSKFRPGSPVWNQIIHLQITDTCQTNFQLERQVIENSLFDFNIPSSWYKGWKNKRINFKIYLISSSWYHKQRLKIQIHEKYGPFRPSKSPPLFLNSNSAKNKNQ